MERVVLASGVFDILHLGHIYYLEESRALGDFLCVVVARDEVACRRKRKPFNDEETRAGIVRALRCVDAVVLGSVEADQQFAVIERVRPALVTIGFDQSYDEGELADEIVGATGISVEVKRIAQYTGKFNKTSKTIADLVRYSADFSSE